ncbi:MAG TPA: oligosaccharide flippase family protein [Candidatus Sulfotelmatobacter sp.]
MSLKVQAVKNVSATWLGLLVHAAVGFFLSPFILHKLGDEAFSVWVLVFAFTGYYGLLDLGIRSSIVKYTANFVATNDVEQLSRYLSTSIAFYTVVAVGVLLATVAVFFHLQSLFKIPVGLVKPAKILLLLSGASIALTFPFGVFAGVLEGLQKFSWLQLSNMAVTMVRAVLIVVALRNGGGLIAVGIITVAMNLLSYLAFACLAFVILPVRLSTRNIDPGAFRRMASYGFFAFAILTAEKLRFQSDALVLGAVLSSSAITSFSIGARLVEYSSYAVRSMSQIVTPIASQLHAAGDLVRLRWTLVAGNQACALICFPLCVTLVILGKSIIECWVGARYVSSYVVLIVLLVPRSIYLAQSTSTRVLLGMGRHRLLASILLLEGGVNLLLSLALVHRFGMVGVAVGTAIPLMCTSLLFLPFHVCRVLEMPVWSLLGRAYRLPVVLCVPLAAVLLLAEYEFPGHGYGSFLPQIACGGAVYLAGMGLAFSKGIRLPRSWQEFAQALEPK